MKLPTFQSTKHFTSLPSQHIYKFTRNFIVLCFISPTIIFFSISHKNSATLDMKLSKLFARPPTMFVKYVSSFFCERITIIPALIHPLCVTKYFFCALVLFGTFGSPFGSKNWLDALNIYNKISIFACSVFAQRKVRA